MLEHLRPALLLAIVFQLLASYQLPLAGALAPDEREEGLRNGASVPIRGDKDLELNCPSVAPSFEWPVGTLRCEACRAIARTIVHRVFVAYETVDEALDGDELCPRFVDTATLRQWKNGKRFVHVAGVDEDAAVAGTAATFHTAAERKTLPCFPYLLRARCFAVLEEHEDAFETALSPTRQFLRAQKRSKEANGVVARDNLTRQLEAMCRDVTRDCREDGAMRRARKAERERFMKYEARYGSDNFKYVEDESTPGLLVRNPFAKGGERERENEFLRRDDLTDEDEGYHDLG